MKIKAEIMFKIVELNALNLAIGKSHSVSWMFEGTRVSRALIQITIYNNHVHERAIVAFKIGV
jgi:hypothetical protein